MCPHRFCFRYSTVCFVRLENGSSVSDPSSSHFFNHRSLFVRLLKATESLSLSSGACRKRAREQLDSWLNSSIHLLQETYNEKSQEIDQLFDTLTTNLDAYKQRQASTLEKQNPDLLRQEIEELNRQLPTLIEVCWTSMFFPSSSNHDLRLGEEYTRFYL